MRGSAGARLANAASVLFAAAPFVVSVVAAVGRRHDLRWFAMAIVAFAGAAVVVAFGRARGGRPASAAATAVGIFVATAVLAAAMAYLLGARAAAGIWAVAVVYALCFTASFVVGMRARGGATGQAAVATPGEAR